jgi:hypothetical protein
LAHREPSDFKESRWEDPKNAFETPLCINLSLPTTDPMIGPSSPVFWNPEPNKSEDEMFKAI